LNTAFWSSVHARFYFAGNNTVDGLAQMLTTQGGNPNLVQAMSSYMLAPISGLNTSVNLLTMGYDVAFQRFVISGNIGQTYYSSGSSVIASLGSGGAGGLIQSYGDYIQARATQPADYGQRATIYMDSATQNLVMRWGGIGYNLGGASATVDTRFDGTQAQTFYPSSLDGQVAIAWNSLSRQVTFQPVGTSIGGSTTVICTYTRSSGTTILVNTVLSAALTAGATYFLATAATTATNTYNLSQVAPMYCKMTLAPATGTTSTTAWYSIEVNIATAGSGNISIRRISRR
jgi:hypothetical protein